MLPDLQVLKLALLLVAPTLQRPRDGYELAVLLTFGLKRAHVGESRIHKAIHKARSGKCFKC